MEEKQVNSEKPQGAKLSRPVRLVMIVLLGLLGLFFALNLAIRIPAVQSWGVKKIGSSLSEELGVPVEVGSFYYDFKSKLSIRSVYVPDFHQDTLIFVGEVHVHLRTGIWSLLKNRLHLNDLSLCDAIVLDRWYEGESESDFTRFVRGLGSGEPDTTRKPFDLAFHAVHLSNIHYGKYDLRNGAEMQASLMNGLLNVKGLWRIGDPFVIEQIFLDDPHFSLKTTADSIPPVQDSLAQDTVIAQALRFPLEGFPAFSVRDIRVFSGRGAIRDLDASRQAEAGLPGKGVFVVDDFNFHAKDLEFDSVRLRGVVSDVNANTNTGLNLKQAYVNAFSFDSKTLNFEGFQIETNRSHLGDTLRFKFREMDDWRDFANRVLIDADFGRSDVAFADITDLVPSLRDSRFFKRHPNETVKFSGIVSGRVNNLRLREFAMSIGEHISLRGDVSSRNLTVSGEEILNMKVSDLKTSVPSLRRLIPGFNFPENFNKLGRVNFSGRFDGYFQDFVAYGKLVTEIGTAETDMRLDVKRGVEKATYSGELQLRDFDLGRWTGNADVGKVSLSAIVQDGRGLRAENASAKLSANVASLRYKSYTYRNLEFHGTLNSNLLDGEILMEDPNVDFHFIGEVNFRDSITHGDFLLNLRSLSLKALGLSERPFVISSMISLNGQGKTVDDVVGFMRVDSLRIQEGDSLFMLDSLLISQNFVADQKQLLLRSPWISGEVNGRYSFGKLPGELISMWREVNPQLAANIGLKADTISSATIENNFSYDLRVDDAGTVFSLLKMHGWAMENARLRGDYHGPKGVWDINGDIPRLVTPGGTLSGIHLSTDFFDRKTEMFLEVDTFEQENIMLRGSRFYVGVEKDSAVADIIIKDSLYSLDFFESRVAIAARDSLFAVHVLRDEIQIDGERWEFSDNNELVFGRHYFSAKNMAIRSGKKEIGLFPMGRTGIVLDIISFNGDLINLLLRDPKFRFGGELSGQFRLNHIFKREGFSGDLTLEPFIVNGDDHGILMVSAEGIDLKHKVETQIQIFRPGGKIEANGWFDLGEKADPERIFYFDVGVRSFPMVVLDYLVPNGISNTVGNFDGQLAFYGGKGVLQLLGELELNKAATNIDFLGTRYFFDKQRIVFKPSMIDFSGAMIKDIYGNEASITGGLTHKQMKKFALNARIQSSNFLFLDTDKEDNPDYYGRGLGRADVRFSGDFINPNIYVNATTAGGTRFVIPVDDDIGEVSTSFVKFVDQDSVKNLQSETGGGSNLTGLNFFMDLEVRDAAQVKIIFDEAQGNIMEGYGRGNIQLNITRTGDFTVRGDYEIERGEYLFTLMNFVNKPFTVRRGGIIRWTGDPLDAQIDLQADYSGLRTSLTNFLSEYGLTGQLASEAQRSTEVELTMRLTGSLLRPNLDFSLNFPEVPESLRSYVDSKVRNLSNNKEQMNTQVFGLIVFRSFLPTNDVGGGILGNTVGSTVGTISEMLANQFSNMISALLSEAVDSWDMVSGVEFNIDYNQPTGAPQGTNDFRFGEVAVSQSVRLLNDRWVVTLGANYGNNYFANNRYFSPQVELSWKTPVEGLNLQVYYRTEQFFTGLKQKAGAGIRFHKEYDDFRGFFRGAKEAKKAGESAESKEEQ